MEDKYWQFLYRVVRKDGTSYVDCKFERALKKYEEDDNCIKMYAFTKRLKPTYILLFTKEVSLMAHFFIASMRIMAYT